MPRDDQRAGVVITAVGLAAAVIGAVGFAASGSSSPAATPATTGAPSATGRSTTTTTVAPETPAQFLDLFSKAIRDGDVPFLSARLHPAVVARYGQATGQTHLTSFKDATAEFNYVSASAPADYEWKTDNQVTVVPASLSVTVNRVAAGQTAQQVIHITAVDGKFRWYTDCTP